ncbi:MAG: DUF1275 domain-containing protein [Cytophagales bacterium]|nr:DUF1275 domain-containing protein [Cytophagales bacterium]
MYRHHGKRRNFIHNVCLAVLLSLTAGITGVISLAHFGVLTTNLTGHAARIPVQLAEGKFPVTFLWILCFLTGAIACSWLIEFSEYKKRKQKIGIPLLIEVILLLSVSALIDCHFPINQTTIIVMLLLAMGIQNAMVTKISGAVVRTTHLTGMITDLGIELADLFFKKKKSPSLYRKLVLHSLIISNYILGGALGLFLFNHFDTDSFLFPAMLLIFTGIYDSAKKRYIIWKRKRKHQHELIIKKAA